MWYFCSSSCPNVSMGTNCKMAFVLLQHPKPGLNKNTEWLRNGQGKTMYNIYNKYSPKAFEWVMLEHLLRTQPWNMAQYFRGRAVLSFLGAGQGNLENFRGPGWDFSQVVHPARVLENPSNKKKIPIIFLSTPTPLWGRRLPVTALALSKN